MRIRFTKETDVKIDAIPSSEWGRLQLRSRFVDPTATGAPTIDPETQTFKFPQHAPVSHCFPVDASPDLPDGMAQQFLDQGVAEIFNGPQRMTEDEYERTHPTDEVRR